MQNQTMALSIALLSIPGLVWLILWTRGEFFDRITATEKKASMEHALTWTTLENYKFEVAKNYTPISMFKREIKSLKAALESASTIQAEREACAKLVEEWAAFNADQNSMLDEIAEAIRNRGAPVA